VDLKFTSLPGILIITSSIATTITVIHFTASFTSEANNSVVALQ